MNVGNIHRKWLHKHLEVAKTNTPKNSIDVISRSKTTRGWITSNDVPTVFTGRGPAFREKLIQPEKTTNCTTKDNKHV